ncbi:ficolin-1-like [Drosophila tropicalis]|uniref:ficolin-1-like n=1 Tax=Drosophila tropicalis TaxID=46794 RepID=UPI0035AC18B4
MVLPGYIAPMTVRCQIGPEKKNGNWIVIQRRYKGTENFFRGWEDYKNGFGDLKTEFFYGLEKVHRMTTHEQMELGWVVKRFNQKENYLIHEEFEIGDENSNYKIVEINRPRGYLPKDAVEELRNMEFSTYDRKNDQHDMENCALTYRSGWWFKKCFKVNLNGVYTKKSERQTCHRCIRWVGLGEGLEFTMMMLRPREDSSSE